MNMLRYLSTTITRDRALFCRAGYPILIVGVVIFPLYSDPVMRLVYSSLL